MEANFDSNPESRSEKDQDAEQSVHHYKFSDLQEEQLNEKISRKLVVGRNEMLGYLLIKKGCVVPAHKHVSEQITIILKGALEFTTQGKKIVVREGETLLIPPNVEHAAIALDDTIDLDCFSPLREDWLTGKDQYLRQGSSTNK